MYSPEERIAMFPELSYLHSEKCRKFAEFCLSKVPEYFFHVPASSSGKYHPAYALGEGGLVRHTRAAMNIFKMMENNEFIFFDDDSRLGVMGEDFFDAGLLALLLHDTFKSGTVTEDTEIPPSDHTVFDHPIIASQFVFGSYLTYPEPRTPIMMSIVKSASEAITSHMGIWNISKYSNTILPTPYEGDWLAKVVHLCDYLASRKSLIFDFNALESSTEG